MEKKVDLNEVLKLIEALTDINATNLKDLVFIKDGKEIKVTQTVVDEWSYAGLNNMEFIKNYLLKDEVNAIYDKYWK